MTVLSPTAQTLIGNGVSGAKFSVTSPPIVPGLQYVWQRPQLVFRPMTDIPTQHLKFQELCASDSDYSVNTIWGEAEGEVYNDEDGEDSLRGVSFTTFQGSEKDPFIYKLYHQIWEHANGFAGNVNIENELSYTSTGCLFAIKQFMLISAEPEMVDQDNSSFAIAFGMELLKLAGKERVANNNSIWKKIVESMEKDKVTPLTAYLIAHFLNTQLHGKLQMVLDVFEAVDEEEYLEPVGNTDGQISIWNEIDGVPEFDRLPEEVRNYPKEDQQLWFKSNELFETNYGNLFFDNGFGEAPLISVYYIPQGDDSGVAQRIFGFTPDVPTIIIAQNMSIYDDKPFAPLFGDLMAAAKVLQPDLPFDPA